MKNPLNRTSGATRERGGLTISVSGMMNHTTCLYCFRQHGWAPAYQRNSSLVMATLNQLCSLLTWTALGTSEGVWPYTRTPPTWMSFRCETLCHVPIFILQSDWCISGRYRLIICPIFMMMYHWLESGKRERLCYTSLAWGSRFYPGLMASASQARPWYLMSRLCLDA